MVHAPRVMQRVTMATDARSIPDTFFFFNPIKIKVAGW